MQLFTRDGVTLTLEGDGVAWLEFSRPPMNVLSRAIQDALAQAAMTARHDNRVRVVVLKGGGNVFAAGADVKEMSLWSRADARSQVGPMHQAFNAVADIEVPVIAAIAGLALGGGAELAMCADIRIAAQDAILGQPEILLGIIPGAGGTQRLPALVGAARAAELIFTGGKVSAAQACAMGWVNEVVPSEDLLRRTGELASELAKGPTLALRAAKRALRGAMNHEAGMALEREEFAELFGSMEQQAGFAAFLAKKPANFRADNQVTDQ